MDSNVGRQSREHWRGGVPDVDGAQVEVHAAIRARRDELPDRCRQIFELSRFDGLKYAEIATRLGISVKTVEVQMGKALRILRQRLKAWLPAGESL